MQSSYNTETPQDLPTTAKKQKLEDIKVILDMRDEVLSNPASKWDIRHLIAYRLLVGPESPFLPTFLDVHHNSCPVCGNRDTPPQTLDIGRVRSLTGETPQNLCQQTESELLRLPEGFFWAALAGAARHESAKPVAEKVYPQRARTSVQWEGYVPSATAIPGSSSPTLPSSSDFGNDTDDFDDNENETRRGKPEEVTVHLVTCFLQVALGLCLLQHPTGTTVQAEVRPRLGRLRSTVGIAGSYLITAEDDGGVCRMRHTRQGWVMDQPYLAII
ncbi:hypothetical protein QBC46DRAFT_130651, partial [Diplogelasinospora grovesii]